MLQRHQNLSITIAGVLSLLFVLSGVAPMRLSLAAPASVDEFRRWIATFRETALARGIRPEMYDSLTADLVPDFSLPDLDIDFSSAKQPEQPEFVRSPEQYLQERYLSQLAMQGRRLFAVHKDTLAAIERTYHVDPFLLLALWGRETAFGTYKLPHNALRVLATQAFIGRRKAWFQTQFVDALRLVQDGAIKPEDMKSSWAGAMGPIQFMPEDYYNYAVDQDGDGNRDIWNSVPDALASLANNFARIGWKYGEPWGFEVSAGRADCSLAQPAIRKSIKDWAALGVAPLTGETFPAEAGEWEASLLMPAGTLGPAFLTFHNFRVIREYNKADLYALFVGTLADRIKGGGSFRRPWERVVQIPSADVEDLQRRLAQFGLYGDKIDGKAGGVTRSAVGSYQKQAGLPQTCWPGAGTIAHLRTMREKTFRAPRGSRSR